MKVKDIILDALELHKDYIENITDEEELRYIRRIQWAIFPNYSLTLNSPNLLAQMTELAEKEGMECRQTLLSNGIDVDSLFKTDK